MNTGVTMDAAGSAIRDLLSSAVRQFLGTEDISIIERMTSAARLRHLDVAETLYSQGDLGNSMHIVLSGRLRVLREFDSGEAQVIAYPSSGEAVGEIAILTGAPRAATVSAVRRTLVAEIERSSVDQLIAQHPELLGSLARMIIGRFTGAQGRVAARETSGAFVVLPLHSLAESIDMTWSLTDELLRAGTVCCLSRDAITAAVSSDREELVGLYLDKCESAYDYLLLKASRSDPRWSQTCIGFADTIILVADASESSAVTDIERTLGLFDQTTGRGTNIELILLHRSGSRPVGTSAWLRHRKVSRHHHVRIGYQPDIARVARFLTGRAIGLVLAGGGARGFAHIGILQALEELRIPIDAIGGASFGALVATGPARERSHDLTFAEQRYVFAEGDPIGDFTIPIFSLVRGMRLEAILSSQLPQDIEDLFIPYYAVSSDLTACRVRIHDTGPLWKAVRASISLPAILPPMLSDGHLLVDGGVLNNLPVDAMRAKLKGRVIAVDLSGEQSTNEHAAVPSLLQFAKSILSPSTRREAFPTVFRIIMQVTTLASRRERGRARDAADLYVCPPVADHDFLDWSRMGEIVGTGYEHGKAAIAQWLDANPTVSDEHSALPRWMHQRDRTNV